MRPARMGRKAPIDFGIVIHGGAGSFRPSSKSDILDRKRVLSKSASEGFAILEAGGSTTDAVERAIRLLEDSGVFNAGSGASLTLLGEVTTDAAIMMGDLECGAVAASNVTKNPISLARDVMERSDHVFLAGNEALLKFSQAIGRETESIRPSSRTLERYRKNLRAMKKGRVETWPRNYELLNEYFRERKNKGGSKIEIEAFDTVGAVAVDARGRVCAGVSTGGRWLKLPGRVGDSAIIGAGIYADDSAGAVSATGAGEEIIRVCLSKTVCDLMKIGVDAQSACEAAINMLTNRRGYGIAGVIAVDSFGSFGAARNTEMLQRAFKFDSMESAHVAVLPRETNPVQKRVAPDLRRLNF